MGRMGKLRLESLSECIELNTICKNDRGDRIPPVLKLKSIDIQMDIK